MVNLGFLNTGLTPPEEKGVKLLFGHFVSDTALERKMGTERETSATALLDKKSRSVTITHAGL